MKFSHIAAAAALVAVASPAFAVDCQAGSVTATFTDLSTAAFGSCSGAFEGQTLNTGTLAYVATSGGSALDGSYDFVVKANEGTSDGNFGLVPNTNSGTLTFDDTVYGTFVLALKAGNFFSYYAFDGGSLGIDAITFNTLGVGVSPGSGNGLGLSHANLYGGELVPAIPEPSTYALMLAGLGAVGLVARRRRVQK